MTVPEEAVETAARVLWYSEKYAKWESVPQYRKEPFLNEARKALEAAAPFIAAQAWDEGEQAGYINHANEQWSGASPMNNPYGSGT